MRNISGDFDPDRDNIEKKPKMFLKNSTFSEISKMKRITVW